MYSFIKKVLIVGLFEEGNDYLIEFEEGSNCLFGDNGTGKTTLINLIVGCLMADLPTLMSIKFEYIYITLIDDNSVEKDVTVYKSIIEEKSTASASKSYEGLLNSLDNESRNKLLMKLEKLEKLEQIDIHDVTIVYDFGDEDISFFYPQEDSRMFFQRKISKSRKYQQLRVILNKLINLTHVPLLRVQTSEDFYKQQDNWTSIRYDKDFGFNRDYFIDPSTSVLYEIEKKFKDLARKNSAKDTEKLEGFKSQIIQKFLVDKTSMGNLPRINTTKNINEVYEIDDLLNKLHSAGLNVSEDKLKESFEVLNELEEETKRRINDVETTYKNKYTKKAKDAETKVSESFFKMLVARSLFERFESVLDDVESLQFEREGLWKLFDDYEQLLNQFLNNKFFKITRDGEFQVFSGTRKIELADLSSGEKHIIAILGRAALSRDKGSVFIADEPELSLHLTWQRKMLPSILALSPKSQIIVATHSPAIIPKDANKINLGECR